MRFLPLLFANLGRKKVRTVLTAGSFAVALFLFGLLATVRAAFHAGIEAAGADRLVVTNRVSLIQPLPLAYRDKIARVPGVKELTLANWFGGVYQDRKNFFPQFAIDHETYKQMFSEFEVAPEEWAAFVADKQGAIAGPGTAERYGWKIGDRIPIQGTIFQGAWEFNLRGIYKPRRPQDDRTQFWFRWDYLQERAPPFARNFAGWYVVRIDDPDHAVQVGRSIDAAFANSAWETRTQTEAALNASFLKQLGNIEFLIVSIGGVVFFTLLLVTGNTMASAVRERTAELAVLKAIGYSDGFVLRLVLAESLVLAGAGGALGLGLAKLFTAGGDPTGGFLPVFHLSAPVIAAGFGVTALAGMAAGALPALAAKRLNVIEALRQL